MRLGSLPDTHFVLAVLTIECIIHEIRLGEVFGMKNIGLFSPIDLILVFDRG